MGAPKIQTIQESTTIPFSKIEVDQEFNCREKYDDIEELTDSIRSQGLITPLTVLQNGSGLYKLVSGFRRYQALKNLKTGDRPINVVIRKFESDSQLHLANLVENTARDEVCPADLAKRLFELETGTYKRVLHPLEEGVEDDTTGEKIAREEIAKQTGLSTAHIGNLIRAHKNLSDSVKKMWRKHNTPLSKVIKWSAIKDEGEQMQAFGEWKEQIDLEKTEGKKRKPRKAKAEKSESESESSTEGGNVCPTKAELRDEIERLVAKMEKQKGAELQVTEAKYKTLRWVVGDISRSTWMKG